jgi:Sec-independent protein translocase protein TatA
MLIFLIIGLAVLLLGTKRLPAIIAHALRAKAQFERATNSVRTQLAAELEVSRERNRGSLSPLESSGEEESA